MDFDGSFLAGGEIPWFVENPKENACAIALKSEDLLLLFIYWHSFGLSLNLI